MATEQSTNAPSGATQDETPAGRAPEAQGNGAAPTAALGAATVVDVEQELQTALAKASENYDLYLRAKAEADNARRRAQDEVSKAHKYAVESLAESLLPVMDSLDKALEVKDAPVETVREGVQITLRQLLTAFDKARLVPINPVGEKFDPHRHQAISGVPAPAGMAPNHVVAVLQKGWLIADRVLRPALVTVSQ